jgi:hypothetical protein
MTQEKINMKLLNKKKYAQGKTFLQFKVYTRSIETVKEIFEFLKSKSISVKDEINKYTGRDGLLSLSFLNFPMMDLLFENGADPNLVLFIFGRYISIRYTAMVSYLMKHGANFHENFLGPKTEKNWHKIFSHGDILKRFNRPDEENGNYLFSGLYTEQDFMAFFNHVSGIETIKILCSGREIPRLGTKSACSRFFNKDLIRSLFKFII